MLTLRAKASVDRTHREASRVRLRVLVKRARRWFGYLPYLEGAPARGALPQAAAVMAWEFAR